MSLKHLTKGLLLILLAEQLSAEPVLLYKNYINQTYSDAKNSIMVGATTATAKGASALLSNPAGLSTNANMTIYAKTIAGEKLDKDDVVISEILPEDNIAFGAIYDEFAVEYRVDNYAAIGGAYGYDSRFGLFSVGATYLSDLTDRDGVGATASDEGATGDYGIIGFMWQKSFIDEEDFYAVYFGLSKKTSGKHEATGNKKIIPVSPEKLSYGIGVETNVFDTTILVTLDMSEESWLSSSEKLSGVAYGLKWMIGEKFAIGGGMNTQTFSGARLKDIVTIGAGLEFGISIFHFNISALERTVNDEAGEVYLKETSGHVDVSLVF